MTNTSGQHTNSRTPARRVSTQTKVSFTTSEFLAKSPSRDRDDGSVAIERDPSQS